MQGAEADKEDEDEEPTWMDRVTDWCVVRAGGKIRGVSLVPSDDGAKGIQVRPSLSVLDAALTYTFTAPPLAVQQLARIIYHPHTSPRQREHRQICTSTQGGIDDGPDRTRADACARTTGPSGGR